MFDFLLSICLISVEFLGNPEEPRDVEENFFLLNNIFHNLSIHPSKNTGCFHALAIVNNTAMYVVVHISFWGNVLFSSDKQLKVELLDHMLVLLMFWGTSILFSIVVVPIYIPTSSEGRLPFLHILTNISFWG